MTKKSFWNLSFTVADVIKVVTGAVGVLTMYFSAVNRIDTQSVKTETRMQGFENSVLEIKGDIKEIKTDIKDLLKRK